MTMKKHALLILYTFAIVAVSVLPRTELPGHGHMDKIGHFIAYFGLAILAWQVMPNLRLRLLAAVGAVGLGGLLEVVQHFIPGRSASYADAAVNTLGVAVGLAVGAVVAPRITRCVASVGRRLHGVTTETVEGR
ncbi:MAG: hypothetical protein GF331_13685 [Chitinivibrionales bacterium]|nr:hypothetical protein [Chitinivibrionales bacterium]